MMTLHEIYRAADLARAAGDVASSDGWRQLAQIIGEHEARERLKYRKPDPIQQDHDEYIDEMSLGGMRYRS